MHHCLVFLNLFFCKYIWLLVWIRTILCRKRNVNPHPRKMHAMGIHSWSRSFFELTQGKYIMWSDYHLGLGPRFYTWLYVHWYLILKYWTLIDRLGETKLESKSLILHFCICLNSCNDQCVPSALNTTLQINTESLYIYFFGGGEISSQSIIVGFLKWYFCFILD